MFGRKARHIENLEIQNGQLAAEAERMRTIYSSAEPYIPFAEALKERVEQRTEQVDVEEIDAAFDRAMQDVEEEMVQQHIEVKLGMLPPETLLSMYSARFDDETVLAALQNAAKQTQREAQKRDRLDIIAQQAKEGHYFDLGHALEDEVVHIRLNDTSYGYEGDSFDARMIRLRKHSEKDNLFVVLYDGPEDPLDTFMYLDSEKLPINSTVRVGAEVIQAGSTMLDSRISFFTPLTVLPSDTALTQSTKELVTQVALGNPRNVVLDSFMCDLE